MSLGVVKKRSGGPSDKFEMVEVDRSALVAEYVTESARAGSYYSVSRYRYFSFNTLAVLSPQYPCT